MNNQPLDELELYELIVAAYPDRFDESSEADIWDDVMEFADEISGGEVDSLCDLLGRVAMLCMPIQSGLSGRMFHALGTVTFKDGQANMIAAVKRKVSA